jgi:hypothetical protein
VGGQLLLGNEAGAAREDPCQCVARLVATLGLGQEGPATRGGVLTALAQDVLQGTVMQPLREEHEVRGCRAG